MKGLVYLLTISVFIGALSGATLGQTVPTRFGFPKEDAGKRTVNLQVEGVAREVVFYRPPNLPANQAVPVVFVFHGTGGSGEGAYDDMGWKEKAEQEGFMAVFPSALRYHIFDETLVKNGQVLHDMQRNTTKFNFFGFEKLLDPAYPDQHVYDDVKFVQVIVELLTKHYAVDADRFYVTGFSNGGQFAQRLLVQMSDVFAAFALCSIGRGFNAEDFTHANDYTSAPFQPRTVMHMIGELDPKLNYAAQVAGFPLDESAAAPGTWTNAVMQGFVQLLGLSADYGYKRTPRASVFHYGGTGATTYDFVLVEGMRHIYPNGENFSFQAVDVFWLFLKQHHR
ncbi:MAG: dienelactone hydrolase family protein [Acidobacteria bacterium]|nr:dienelactone hydrolase family protein [Acidobacteriota bacterium]MBI3423183.1 dienelactone hydrolase family protein [Acidobacteriota bacterium]